MPRFRGKNTLIGLQAGTDDQCVCLRAARKKEVVTLRLPVSVIDKAKAVGKGYTGFLSRLVENAINDKDIVSRSL